MLSINVFTEIDVSFSKFQPHVNFCDSYETYQYKLAQKLLKVAKIGKSSKVAQKLPSTICLGLVA